ncbi:MAG: DUF5011 domain-containing protein, partial [Candidatus Eisenbacteria bacterium]
AGDLSAVIHVSGAVDANTVGTYTLTYDVQDPQGNHATATRTVHVVDTTAPALTLTGAPTMTVECHSIFADPGATATDLCAGTVSSAIQVAGAVNANAVGSYTLTYSVNDGNGNTSSAQRVVNVVDTTAPTLTSPGAITLNTGPSATACGVLVSDAALGAATASDLCAGAIDVHRGGVPSGSFFPVGVTKLTYTATDPSGNVAAATQTITVVDNTPPTLSGQADLSRIVDAGACAAVVRYDLVKVSDNCPGATWTASPPSGSSFAVGTTTPVKVVATDAAGNTSSCTFNVSVTNPAPIATIVAPASGAVSPIGTAVTFSGSFTDNAGDTHTAQWLLDGQPFAGVVNEAARTVSLTRTFTTAGVYAVSLSVTDQCGGVGTASEVGGLMAMVVLYDPSGGFVTGGGWIDSPAGAFRADTTLTGKANFGFVSKYQKGATTPSGNTEFQFKAGDLNFHSATYEWLVVSGARAQFKGSGTINGTGDYGFLLSAVDGDATGGGKIDKLRMKIWSKATSAIVYDNNYGSPDTSAASTALGGGSIMITNPPKAGRTALAQDTGVDGAGSSLACALAPAMPNPFRSTTTLRFSVPARSRVTIAVYDAAGREVGRPLDGMTEPGLHAIDWPAVGGSAAVRSGVFFVRMVAIPESGGRAFTETRSIVLVR